MLKVYAAKLGCSFFQFLFLCLVLIIMGAGCASQDAQTRAENVAKNWCNTIRASQIIPVYPLTADLLVGDVFLVQTPVSTQAQSYRERGFLALDDHRYRIPYTNFTNFYYSGYWTNTYWMTPHTLPVFTNSGAIGTNAVTNTQVDAPRVMFPTFTFQAESSGGLSAAFPIEGIPVGLNYLRSDKISGTLSITDARTYAGDESDLRSNLIVWAGKDDVKKTLAATAKAVSPTIVYLRVVSRIYLARAVEASLYSATQQQGGARVGNTPDVALLSYPTNATNIVSGTNTNSLASTISNAASNLLNVAQVGGAAKFSSVGYSSVTLNQTFDQMLAVGYLGFDVPVYENGSLGFPVPTFQRLEGNVGAWLHPTLDANQNIKTLKSIAKIDPKKAVQIMAFVSDYLEGTEFRLTGEMLSPLVGQPLSATNTSDKKKVAEALGSFKSSTFSYLSRPYWFSWHAIPQRLNQFNHAFDEAWAVSKDSTIPAPGK